jgi:hypothetical protein
MKTQFSKVPSEKERNMNYKVYVIHSAKPLSELKKLLEECGGYSYAGIIYKSLQRRSKEHGKLITKKEETKKTIVFCTEQTIQKLVATYPIYKGMVADYNWESFPIPSDQQGETWDLHISNVPNDYTVQEAEMFVIETLKCVLPVVDGDKTNFIVEFVPRLRETGEIYGFGHIRFSPHVDHQLIKLCKLVLHNTPVSSKTDPKQKRMVTCVWHRTTREVSENSKSKFKPKSFPIYRARPATLVQHVNVSGIDKSAHVPLSTIIHSTHNSTDGVVSPK